MKKINIFKKILFLSLIFASEVNADFGSSIKIYHFNPQNSLWNEETIEVLITISNIFSAGKYAWAFAGERIAFYDGNHWHAAASLPGCDVITQFYPGFPRNGKQSIAWAKGKNQLNQVNLFYFDGSNWKATEPLSNHQIDNESIEIAVSAGYAWVRYYDIEERKHVFKMANEEYPLTWQSLPNPPSNIIMQMNSFDDNVPNLYVVGETLSNTLEVFQMGASNQWKSIRTINSFAFNQLLVSDSNVFIAFGVWDEKSNYHDVYSYSLDNGITWDSNSIADFNRFYQYNFHKELSCSAITYKENRFMCIKHRSGDSPIAKVFLLPPTLNENALFQIYTTQFGAWTVSDKNNYLSNPAIFYFDFNFNQLIDTHVENVISNITRARPLARAIGQNELVTTGTDKTNKTVALYFDGKNWISSVIPLVGSDHCLSRSGNTVHPTFTTEDKNVWIFPGNSVCRKT